VTTAEKLLILSGTTGLTAIQHLQVAVANGGIIVSELSGDVIDDEVVGDILDDELIGEFVDEILYGIIIGDIHGEYDMTTKNFTRIRGDTYPFKVTVSVNSAPYNLTSATALFGYSNSGNTKATITGAVTNAAGGEITFTPTGTDFLKAGVFDYDVQVTKAGIITTFIVGKLTLSKDV